MIVHWHEFISIKDDFFHLTEIEQDIYLLEFLYFL